MAPISTKQSKGEFDAFQQSSSYKVSMWQPFNLTAPHYRNHRVTWPGLPFPTSLQTPSLWVHCAASSWAILPSSLPSWTFYTCWFLCIKHSSSRSQRTGSFSLLSWNINSAQKLSFTSRAALAPLHTLSPAGVTPGNALLLCGHLSFSNLPL